MFLDLKASLGKFSRNNNLRNLKKHRMHRLMPQLVFKTYSTAIKNLWWDILGDSKNRCIKGVKMPLCSWACSNPEHHVPCMVLGSGIPRGQQTGIKP